MQLVANMQRARPSSLIRIRNRRIIIAGRALYNSRDCCIHLIIPFILLIRDRYLPETAIWLDGKSVASEDIRDRGRIPKPDQLVPVQYVDNVYVSSRGNDQHDKLVPNSPVRVSSEAQESSCIKVPNTV
jgi:hypothetical protein